MTWEKGIAFAQCFLMGQFGALSSITWITNDMREKHDTALEKMKQEHDRQIAEQSRRLEELRGRLWW